ncbi:sigma-70 family RNA polymerase sigma factor [Tranquillimonas alkanivorans]|uniref:RNA polymerase sigma factor, sigma-70 family n=1 Tax=Tranquillimonas alkanivorans TaxID=441119 RepID=A0A1I5TUN4_9RHOB|nr:sigma-70 family RNA polymerase sigma factor [Tranquillimonas alkanivorans]SFP86016.1 RNA polymerase sigma factor, sigma-70 family [Tranquillimonas alkanivorans]
MTTAKILRNTPAASELSDNELVLDYQDDIRAGEAAAELCTRYVHLIRSFSVRMNAKMSHTFELDELIQVATEGFLKGIGRFDTSRGFAIATFVGPYVWNALSVFSERSCLQTTNKSSRVRTAMIALMKIQRERAAYGLSIEFSAADLEVVAEHHRLSLGTVRNGLRLLRQYESSAAPLEDLQDELGEEDSRGVVVDDLNANQSASITDELLACLEDREALILRKRHMGEEPVLNKHIAEELGCSEARVRQLEKKALQTLQDQLSRRGLELSDLV